MGHFREIFHEILPPESPIESERGSTAAETELRAPDCFIAMGRKSGLFPSSPIER
jgi:hypothetical protein